MATNKQGSWFFSGTKNNNNCRLLLRRREQIAGAESHPLLPACSGQSLQRLLLLAVFLLRVYIYKGKPAVPQYINIVGRKKKRRCSRKDAARGAKLLRRRQTALCSVRKAVPPDAGLLAS